MPFAPEDKRAWQDSQVMAELEKLAKETGLFAGPPPEAFEPIQLKEAEEVPTWEEDEEQRADVPDPLGVGEITGLEAAKAVKDGLEALANNLVSAGRMREAHMVERTLSGIHKTAQFPAHQENISVVKSLLDLAGDFEDEGHEALAHAVDRQARTYIEQAGLVNDPQTNENKAQQEEGDAPHNPE